MPPKVAARMMLDQPEVRAEYALAERLHKTVQEIRALPNSEWVGWVAYFQLKRQDEELQAIKARQMAKAREMEKARGSRW